MILLLSQIFSILSPEINPLPRWRCCARCICSLPKDASFSSPFLIENFGVLHILLRKSTIDEASLEKPRNIAFNRDHAFVGRGLEHVRKFRNAVIADDIRHSGRVEEDFTNSTAPSSFTRKETLREDGNERERELETNLLLLMRRENVNDTVDGLRGRRSVKRREHQVSGLGERECCTDGFQITHFSDEDHIGVLAEDAAEGFRETEEVCAELTLTDDGLLRLVEEFYRIFEGDDVHRTLTVDRFDHGGE